MILARRRRPPRDASVLCATSGARGVVAIVLRVRGDTIREFVWSGVVTKADGTACGGIMVYRGEGRVPAQFQATEQELHSLARMLRETAREVRRLNKLKQAAKA